MGAAIVFKITPQGKFTQLYVFQGGSDGSNPFGRLIQGSNGNYYGTTAYGGNFTFTSSGGGRFEITPTGKHQRSIAFAHNRAVSMAPAHTAE